LEALCFSETPVNIYQLKWCNITDWIFQTHCYENPTSCRLILYLKCEILTDVQNVHIVIKSITKKSIINATASSWSIEGLNLSSTFSHITGNVCGLGYITWWRSSCSMAHYSSVLIQYWHILSTNSIYLMTEYISNMVKADRWSINLAC